MSFGGNKETMMTCPYDNRHQVRSSRFPYHIVKCARINNKKLLDDDDLCPGQDISYKSKSEKQADAQKSLEKYLKRCRLNSGKSRGSTDTTTTTTGKIEESLMSSGDRDEDDWDAGLEEEEPKPEILQKLKAMDGDEEDWDGDVAVMESKKLEKPSTSFNDSWEDWEREKPPISPFEKGMVPKPRAIGRQLGVGRGFLRKN